LRIVEDAAHALPCTHTGKLVGTLASDVTVFSFYANKAITTGEGGMLVTRDPAIAARARTMRLHGISRDAFDRFTAKKASWYYEIVAPGFKYNLTDIAAAIGIHQLRRANEFQQRRERIARQFDAGLAGLPLSLPPQALPGDLHSWHLYPVQLTERAAVNRETFIDQMFARGIGMSVHYIPLHLQPYWRDTYHLTAEMFPVSQRIYQGTGAPAAPVPGHCGRHQARITRAGVLPPGARRSRWQNLSHPQIQDDDGSGGINFDATHRRG
jgi:dTDP-4-amino-4,6-dideoxygalactose transaminase